MVGQLDLHRTLHQPLGQLGEHTAGPRELLLGASAGEQLVEQLITDPPIGRHPQSLTDPASLSAHARLWLWETLTGGLPSKHPLRCDPTTTTSFCPTTTGSRFACPRQAYEG